VVGEVASSFFVVRDTVVVDSEEVTVVIDSGGVTVVVDSGEVMVVEAGANVMIESFTSEVFKFYTSFHFFFVLLT
jgi:uncharacterized cupin superfamily protein